MVVDRIFLRIKAKNDGWGGVRRISNILGQILVHYYCCIGTKPSFHGAVNYISNLSYIFDFYFISSEIERQKNGLKIKFIHSEKATKFCLVNFINKKKFRKGKKEFSLS